MTRLAPLRALGCLGLLLSGLLLAPAAAGDHGSCPPFERKRYDYVEDVQLGEDLYAVEHVAGFVDFQECRELRHRVTKWDVRFEARGGAYLLHLTVNGEEETHLLQGATNATGWYRVRAVEGLQYAGVSRGGSPTVEPGAEPPPALPRLSL